MTSVLEEVKLYQKTKNGLTSTIYNCQKKNGDRKGVGAPNYTMLELRCWIFSQDNFEELFDCWVRSNYETDKRPSCDRIDDYLGYSLDNLQLMTWKGNREKGFSDVKTGINRKRCRQVNQFSLNGKLIKTHFSMNSASRKTGAGLGNIYSCCVGNYKTAGGFIWRYT